MSKMHAHEKFLHLGIGELLQVQDGQIILSQDSCHGVYDAGLVGTRQCEDVVFRHFADGRKAFAGEMSD